MFQRDLDDFNTQLTTEIASKSVLVIGGAGTIGFSFIKALLKFKPAKLIVVDTNENGLTELTRDLRSEQGQYIPATFLTYPMNFGDLVFEKMFLKKMLF
jgi:FlaA1/EpsC-like NDP-sugar epimerase